MMLDPGTNSKIGQVIQVTHEAATKAGKDAKTICREIEQRLAAEEIEEGTDAHDTLFILREQAATFKKELLQAHQPRTL